MIEGFAITWIANVLNVIGGFANKRKNHKIVARGKKPNGLIKSSVSSNFSSHKIDENTTGDQKSMELILGTTLQAYTDTLTRVETSLEGIKSQMETISKNLEVNTKKIKILEDKVNE